MDYPLVWANTSIEMMEILKYLEGSGLIVWHHAATVGKDFALTAKGWDEVDRLRKTSVASNKAFVAMWFDPSMDEAFRREW